MLTAIALVMSAGYLGVALLGLFAIMKMPDYQASAFLNSGGEGISVFSALYYAAALVLAIQHPGTAAWILVGIIVVPLVIGWIRGDSADIDNVGAALFMGFVMIAAQALCILVMVF